MNESPPWLSHRVIQRILHKLLDMTDKVPIEQRTRSPSFRVNAKTLPELFDTEAVGETEYAWELITEMERQGWITLTLKRGKSRLGYADYENNPLLRLEKTAEPHIRQLLGRSTSRLSHAQQWRELVIERANRFPGQTDLLAEQPIQVPGKSADDILNRLETLIDFKDKALYLREVSARLFWGLSKRLDNRSDMIAELLGQESCPFLEKPVTLHVHIAVDEITGVLLIENETTFEAACRGRFSHTNQLALIYASGFKASAKRLRQSGGSSLYYSSASFKCPSHVAEFEDWLYRFKPALPVWFWGDLDFAGMQILKSLREIFPNIQAYTDGYAPMLEMLEKEMSHAAQMANKQGQIDLEMTGCEYADTQLLPAIRKYQAFVDQEAV
ncbi:MAG: Wadjet anti-phage system protein JetD domain-containing protein [Candidatus Parabeggiatoa sp.]|nr:Wadjet anti-phage system protein JetD domain-containing protein [Candidatus Parabeggiatoa sp.]